MKKANWSVGDAVKILHHENPALYIHLHRTTVWKWKTKNKKCWSEKTLENVENRHALAGSGQASALTKYPELVTAIKTILNSLRASGFVVNVPIAHSIMIGLIHEKNPEALTPYFRCSECYVHSFLQAVMNWSIQVGTQAAHQQKLFWAQEDLRSPSPLRQPEAS